MGGTMSRFRIPRLGARLAIAFGLYALDAVRGEPGGTDDASCTRSVFLEDVATYRQVQATFATDHLSTAELDLAKGIGAGFDRFMENDDQIIALYRSGTATDVTAASALLVGGQVSVFDDIATKVDATALQTERVPHADRGRGLTEAGGQPQHL